MRAVAIWKDDSLGWDPELYDEVVVTDEAPESTDGAPVAVVAGVSVGVRQLAGSLIVYDLAAYRALAAAGVNVKKARRP